jgi:hypothetical protein
MKLFSATVQVVLVVMAETELEALLAAESHADDAARDSGLECDWATEIQSIAELPPGWTGADLPYGGDGTESISAILDRVPPAVVRDTRTIDMFEATQ